VEEALVLADAQIVDAGVAHAHQARRVELPVLISVRTIPASPRRFRA
jgi:hypothetical protein